MTVASGGAQHSVAWYDFFAELFRIVEGVNVGSFRAPMRYHSYDKEIAN